MEIKQPGFGKKLKALRLEKGLKQSDLAGGPVSISYISRIEGGTRIPSAATVLHMAEKLGVSIEELLSIDTAEDSWNATAATVSTLLADEDFPAIIEILQPYGADLSTQLPDGWDWQMTWARFRAHTELRDREGQRADLHQMVALTRRWDAPPLLARLLVDLSEVARALGDMGEALASAEEAISIANHIPPNANTLRIQCCLAMMAAETEAGLLHQASMRVPAVLDSAKEASPWMQARVYWTCSSVRVRQGAFQEGKDLIDLAISALPSRDNILGWARLRVAAISLHLRCSGSTSPVIQTWLKEASDVLGYVGEPVHHAELKAVAARIYLAEGRAAEAQSEAAAAESTGLLAFHDRLRTKLLRAEAAMRLGHGKEGVGLAEEVADEAESAGYLELAAEAWKTVALAQKTPPAA
ncbi:helix-turn-helix domain-containing protein [Streptomyces sp. NPDC001435]|uniref:helix-turn-helix domain-containing protein n=1 Tax=Streptomyces sp. NPDC001435 TaxID=3364576 RepID=UPI003674E118